MLVEHRLGVGVVAGKKNYKYEIDFLQTVITSIYLYISVCVLYACVSYFCICTCSTQLSMFHMERRSRNTLIIIIIIICLGDCECINADFKMLKYCAYIL